MMPIFIKNSSFQCCAWMVFNGIIYFGTRILYASKKDLCRKTPQAADAKPRICESQLSK